MFLHQRSVRFGLFVTAASLMGAAAFAAAPPAGTRIGNQAAATYTNAVGDTVTVTSNKVETIVQQVASVDLEAPVDESASAGGKVFLAHTITNTGNGDDVYDLTAIDADTGPYDFTSINIYPDVDLDGVADSTTPISVTPSLAGGEIFGIVIEAVTPVTANGGEVEEITVTAVSQTDGAINDVNTDSITISSGPITELQKSMVVTDSDNNGTDPGDIVTITISYDSTGLTDAANLTVTDVLDPLLEYQTGTARWSDDPDTLTEASDGNEQTNGTGHNIDFQYDGTDTVSFVIDSVPSGRTGSVTFQAVIAATAPAGPISNVATQTVEDPGTPGTPITMPPSNEPTIVVVEVLQGTLADYESTSYQADPDGANLNTATGVASANDDDGAGNDIVEDTDDAAQGATLPFQFVLTNHSNADEAFDITFANVDFPAGTTFSLVGADGITPISGSVGPLAPGATTTVSLIATLPANLAPTATTDYTATVTATPSSGGTANSATAEFSGAITASALDLISTAPDAGDGGVGDNPTNTGNPWDTNTTDPGVPVSYPLQVTNQGTSADNYDIVVTGVPAGYAVSITLADGTPVSNTGDIPAGGTADLVVTITPPADATPIAADEFDIVLTSPISGQSDSITNAISVGEVVDLRITSDQTRQAAPSGTIDIPHTLFNDGNIDITEGAISLAGDLSTFSGVLYHDVNENGIADASDIIVDNIDDIVGGVAAGDQVELVLRVQVPSSAVSGQTETETINVATNLNSGAATDTVTTNNAVTDTITIISGDLSLRKQQALDPNCDGNPGAYQISLLDANPGECIAYRIIAENTGTDDADNVTITDTTPAWTTFTECTGNCDAVVSTGGTITAQPTEGGTGQLKGEYGTLIPGGVAQMDFTVRIAN